ncbi:hypothetical protein AX17_005698 [Amanita inopinata Kibby_2008]|nr:hypothetical protein AX17_005698 [Amanita inopinata Kibby_2008]
MSFTKNKLKFARDALSKKDFTKAKDIALEVLEYEANNYNAHVFLGLALLELDERDESEQTYRKAIQLDPNQQLAWQGIAQFYERTGRWEENLKALHQLIDIYYSQNDAMKCAETLQKTIDSCRKHNDRLNLVDALCLLLPNSHIYAILSTLPAPDHSSPTATTILFIQDAIYESLPVLRETISLVESHEEEIFKKELEKRRTRIGAPNLDQLQMLVGQEIWGSSKLPALYVEVINHPSTADELRRDTESKLLRYKYRYMRSFPSASAAGKVTTHVLHEINELIDHAVSLRIPDELAWTLALQRMDAESIEASDQQHMREFIEMFPISQLAILLKSYFSYIGSSISVDDESEIADAEDLYATVSNTYSGLSDNIIATRVLMEIYLRDQDYENAAKMAKSSLILLEKTENNIGRRLPRVRIGIKATQVTSLVHLHPPKHHARATTIIEEVLSQSPDNVVCLMGRAYILQAACRWEEAKLTFLRVADLLPEDIHEGIRASEEAAWCLSQQGQNQEALTPLQDVLASLSHIDGCGNDRARCLWRIGQCNWNLRNYEESYRLYIASLKEGPTYAPAFTSLGIYYSEAATPPDPIRASKCLQKAFELDAREAEAARRLASGFADDKEWDLVEVVARRTIGGQSGLESSRRSQNSDSDLQPTSPWAWKAVGIVELNKRNYSDAMRAFQIALKADADDPSLWLRLGEAYNKAGRYAAALRALNKANELDPDSWVCSYFIAEVRQRIGELQEAITLYTTIFSKHPGELVVLVSLIQSCFELGCQEQSEGFLERAELSFLRTTSLALGAIRNNPESRAICWKFIGDALFRLSSQSRFASNRSVRDTLEGITQQLHLKNEEGLFMIMPRPNLNQAPVNWRQVLEVAVMVYYGRLSTSSGKAAAGSAWHDFAIALHSWTSRVYGSVPKETKEKLICSLYQALREDSSNDSYWAALGTIHFQDHPRMAQHAYIKALEIDAKNVITWTNLGLLYLYHEDLELANEAFHRAQTLDPEYAAAWLGRALLCSASKHEEEVQEMLAHVVTLTPTKAEADLQFAENAFQQYLTGGDKKPTASGSLLSAFFSLHRFCTRQPDNASALHLFGLIYEALEQADTAEDLIGQSASLLEAAYEDTEDPTIERQFAIANSNLARLRLSRENLAGALESFQDILGLLNEDHDEIAQKLRVQALFGSGLAQFKSDDLESALGSFEAALSHAGENLALKGQATVLLAQTMWAVGDEELREMAKSRLLQCIASDPGNWTAIETLAAMGVLSNDENLVDATLSELLDLPPEERQELDLCNDASYLLTRYYFCTGEQSRALTHVQRALHATPCSVSTRNRLATMLLQGGEWKSAQAILLGGQTNGVQESSTLAERLRLLAVASVQDESANDQQFALRLVQRAIMLMPSDIRCWQGLALVRSQAPRG